MALIWWKDYTLKQNKRWIILGKGPNFSNMRNEHYEDYNLIGLNHTIQQAYVDICHIYDIEVLRDLQEEVHLNAHMLAMPWFPHKECMTSPVSLDEWAKEYPVLKYLKTQGRLIAYYGSTGAKYMTKPEPTIPIYHSSAEAAVGLLLDKKVSPIHLIGVDGGKGYASEFPASTRLPGGSGVYDKQMQCIKEECQKADTKLLRWETDKWVEL